MYDSARRLRWHQRPGRVSEHQYDSAGLCTKTVLYGDNYDTAGLAPESVVSLSQLQSWAQAQSKTQAQVSTYSYDIRGQLQRHSQYSASDSAGNGVGQPSSTTYVYDQAGQLLSRTDATGNVTQYAYDGLGRVILVKGPQATAR